MGCFEHLSHTADAGFQAHGRDLTDLFETAARAMFSLEYDLASVRESDHQQVSVQAEDVVGLMEIWLSELLFLHDARGLVFKDFKITKLVADPGDCLLEAEVSGSQIGDWFAQTGPQIKAVTLHGMEIVSSDEGASVVAYLDV